MYLILFICFVIILILFFKTSESTFNLWFWSKLGPTEAILFQKPIFEKKLFGLLVAVVESERKYPCVCHNLNVVLYYRTQKRKVGLVEEKLSVQTSIVFPLDVTNFKQVAECCNKVKMFFLKIDVIILCCGQSQRAEWIFVDTKVDEACFRVNALGPTVLAREYMKTLDADPNGLQCFPLG